jgi:hypothetical protein
MSLGEIASDLNGTREFLSHDRGGRLDLPIELNR